MANKRKRDELSDDEVMPGKQILPVANLPHGFDQEPQDGMQYLFLVRRDARRLPHVTRVQNPYELSEAEVNHTCTPSSTNVLPCEEWRFAFQSHFSNLRKNLTQATIYNSSSGRRTIPEKKDRDAWWKFLAGHPESAWRPKDRSVRKKSGMSHRMQAFVRSAEAVIPVDAVQSRGELSHHPLACPAELPGDVQQPCSKNVYQSTESMSAAPFAQISISTKEDQQDHTEQLSPPQVTPSHLRAIDHRMSIHLLMYFTHWINIHIQNPTNPLAAISVSHGQWIFALLTKVEDQLSADEMNLLRNLARACLGLIQTYGGKQAGSNAMSEGVSDPVPMENMMHMSDASCWIIFAAIAGYWGQKDLWTDAEATLASAKQCF